MENDFKSLSYFIKDISCDKLIGFEIMGITKDKKPYFQERKYLVKDIPEKLLNFAVLYSKPSEDEEKIPILILANKKIKELALILMKSRGYKCDHLIEITKKDLWLYDNNFKEDGKRNHILKIDNVTIVINKWEEFHFKIFGVDEIPENGYLGTKDIEWKFLRSHEIIKPKLLDKIMCLANEWEKLK